MIAGILLPAYRIARAVRLFSFVPGVRARRALAVCVVFVTTAAVLPAHTPESALVFPPVIVFGVHADYLRPLGDDEVPSRLEVGPSLALSWRRALVAGAYVAVDGRLELATPLTAWEPSDAQSAAVELAMPVGDDELVFAARIASSFVDAGTPAAEVDTRWSGSYRLLRPAGWIAIVSPGVLRHSSTSSLDVVGQRFGVAVLASPSFRLESRTTLDAGFERFPEQQGLDDEGVPTGASRADLLVSAESQISGLVGFFTTWSADASLTLRDSSLADASRLNLEVGASVSTTPASSLGLSAEVIAAHTRYRSRAAFDEAGDPLGGALRVTQASARLGADLSPLAGLFLLASVDAGLTATNEPTPAALDIVVRAGIEYSF